MKKKTIRKVMAIGCAGMVLGAGASVFVASPASALAYARCDAQATQAEKDLLKQFQSGMMTQAQYDYAWANLQARRIQMGC